MMVMMSGRRLVVVVEEQKVLKVKRVGRKTKVVAQVVVNLEVKN